ncbi:MAG: SAM-dependent methyltransferase, partial [Chloroflexi bacterium]|nr:SAM-dependent methyltransferase [Chloroflexota bacterium]
MPDSPDRPPLMPITADAAGDAGSTDRPSGPDDFALAASTVTAAADDFALAANATPLAPVIRAEIDASGGQITFAQYMALALGHPEHGYYARADLAWGRDGDYETSPEVHPIFGFMWARQVLDCWERLGRPASFALVEAGAGSGAFAVAMLTWLRERAPDCFAAARPVLLDGHVRRLADQQRALTARGFTAEHALFDDWMALPGTVTGIAISNEFFDALPAHLVERRGDALHEWYVAADGEREGGGFRFVLG